MRSSAGSWNGTKHVFNNLSTNNLQEQQAFAAKTFHDQERQA
jgi:hypothetical protein